MIGVVRKNSDREMFIKEGQVVLKNTANGNIDQRSSQKNDWVLGDIGDNLIGIMAKFKGGALKDSANYDIDSEINKAVYPDL